MKKAKIIVILGQTSTGKSDFAVEIAKIINGEVISADSRQVYKGMDLGTGKITKKEMLGIPHYLLDIVSPKKTFSVNDFQRYSISARGIGYEGYIQIPNKSKSIAQRKTHTSVDYPVAGNTKDQRKQS